MRITLFNLSARLSSDGSRLIAALLKRANHKVKSVYMARSEPMFYSQAELECLDDILKQSDLVMIGVYSAYAARAIQITEFVHNRYPGLKVIWGGPHCISVPEIGTQYADGVCFSEGDEAVVELVKRMESGEDYLSTPNMAFNINGSIILNKVLPPFSDLDGLPYCDYEFKDQFLLDKELIPMTNEKFKACISNYPYNKPILFILASRGCPNNCSYCNNCRYTKLFNHNPIRIQSAERIMDELTYNLELLDFVELIGFGDDDFFVRSINEIEDFAEKYKRKIGLPFMIGVSANSFNKKKMEILLDSGLKIIQMGVQSASERILSEVFHRKIKPIKARWAIEQISPYHDTHDLDLLLDFIIDNPYETKADIIATYKFIINLPASIRANVFFLSFFPGTPIYERALAEGIIEPFNYDSFRFYGRGQIKYQKNFETFLVLLAIYLRNNHKKYMPRLILRILAWRIIRKLASLLPESFYGFIGSAIK
jgi:anaerobic magnesium-protoporphyrin IX monomethyl ester cyclase